MKHKGLILMAALSISVAFGCTLGHNMGTSFAKEWSAQSYSITADVKYQSLIDENIFNGEISVSDLTAGMWKSTFNFDIELILHTNRM